MIGTAIDNEEHFMKYKNYSISNHIKLALQKANFIVYYFNNLPDRYQITEDSFREENMCLDYPRSSYKIKLHDKLTKSTIEVKQFNYDWAPPAYDCPSLWANNIIFDHTLIPKPLHFVVNSKVGWIGKNYRNEQALSVIQNRTTTEICIKDSAGKEVDVDLQELTRYLKPADLKAQSQLLDKTYAELSYAGSGSVNIVDVPFSFWRTSSSKELKYQKAFSYPNLPDFMAKLKISIPDSYKYNLDTVFYYFKTSEMEKTGRVEFIYSYQNDRDVNIRVVVWSSSENHSIKYPPEPDITQKFEYSVLKIGDKEVYVAYRNKEVGPFEAVWSREDYNYLLITKPEVFTDDKWFQNLLWDVIQDNNFDT